MKFKSTLLSKTCRSAARLMLLLGVAAFSACKTDVQAPQSVSALAITNASTSATALDFFIDNQKVNSTGLLTGQKVDYVQVYPGTRNGTVTETGTSKSLYSAGFTLMSGQYHSLYILSEGDSFFYFNVKDEFTTPPADKAEVRFMNLSSDSPAYSLEISGETASFGDRAYKTYTPFQSVTPQTAVKLILKNTATNAIVATLDNVELKKEKFYTIWAKGLAAAATDAQKVSLQVSQHFQ